jgi:hypothetical protein
MVFRYESVTAEPTVGEPLQASQASWFAEVQDEVTALYHDIEGGNSNPPALTLWVKQLVLGIASRGPTATLIVSMALMMPALSRSAEPVNEGVSDYSEEIERALEFPDLIGGTNATAIICRIPAAEYVSRIVDASAISQARYQQLGSTVQDELRVENRAYRAYLLSHDARPTFPDCSLFSRQIDDLSILAAHESAVYIRGGDQLVSSEKQDHSR